MAVIHIGKDLNGKEVTVLEFLTNLPSGTTFVGHTADASDRFYAIPYPLHTISASTSAPSGSKTVWVDGTFQYTDSTYSAITYSFQFSSIGDVYAGGTLTNVWIKVCKDVSGVTAYASKQLVSGSITVGSEETNENIYFGTLSSSSIGMGCYVCIWWNNSLQYTTQAFASIDDELSPL